MNKNAEAQEGKDAECMWIKCKAKWSVPKKEITEWSGHMERISEEWMTVNYMRWMGCIKQ